MKTLRNSRKFKLYKEARRELGALYPEAFPRGGHRPTLKIGIFDDIRSHGATGLSMTHCRRFLSIWTSSTAYLRNMKAGMPRVGLDGRVQGIVSERHLAEARQTLKQRRDRHRQLTGTQLKT